jgi:hypothetical protein
MIIVSVVVAVRVFVLREIVTVLMAARFRKVENHPCEHQYAA